MTREIDIQGKKYFVKYGWNAFRLFTDQTKIKLSELSDLQENMTISAAIALIWAGLKDGARAEKVPFELDLDDVADLMDDDPSLMQKCVDQFVASLAKMTSGKTMPSQ